MLIARKKIGEIFGIWLRDINHDPKIKRKFWQKNSGPRRRSIRSHNRRLLLQVFSLDHTVRNLCKNFCTKEFMEEGGYTLHFYPNSPIERGKSFFSGVNLFCSLSQRFWYISPRNILRRKWIIPKNLRGLWSSQGCSVGAGGQFS